MNDEHVGLVTDLVEAMRRESDYLSLFGSRLKALETTMAGKQWPELERQIQEMEAVASRVEETEAKRHASYSLLSEKVGFADRVPPLREMLPLLPEESRRLLAEAHRGLSISFHGAEEASGRLGYHARAVGGALATLLGGLFPHRKGRIYSRRGISRPSAEDSVVVDRRL